MNSVSWERRIRRAEQLAGDHPESAEILQFYAHVARFQHAIHERLKALSAEGRRLESLQPDYPRLLRLIQRVGPPLLARQASELEEGQPSFEEVLAMVWNGSDRRDDASARLEFFGRVLIQPYMENSPDGNATAAKHSPVRCPACSGWPQSAVLRGEGDGAKRWLLCSLCSREWEFRRIVCPNCSEENQDFLPVYTTRLFEHLRVEACDRCGVYIKSVDLTKNGMAIPCVDEIAAVPLDLWAVGAGYTKLQRNILGL